MEKQLTLFSPPISEFDALWKSLIELKNSQDKVRRRLFAEVSDLKKKIVDLEVQNERLKFHNENKNFIRWTA